MNEEVLNERRRRLLKKMLIAGVSLPVILKLLPELMADPKVASDEWDLDSVKLYFDKTNLPNTYIWEDGTDPVINFDDGDQLLYDISANQFLFKIGGTTELSLSSTELNLYTNNIIIDGGAEEGHIQIGGGYRWIGLKTRNNGYSWELGDDPNETFQLSKYDHGTSTWDWGVIAIVPSTGNVQIKHDLKILEDLNMDNGNINNVASIDGGGSAIVFADSIKISKNSSPFSALQLESSDTAQGRVGFDLKTKYSANENDFFRFIMQGDTATVALSVFDASASSFIPMLYFHYLTGLIDIKQDINMDGNSIKNAVISTTGTTTEGAIRWDATNHKLQVYNGSSWETVSSS